MRIESAGFGNQQCRGARGGVLAIAVLECEVKAFGLRLNHSLAQFSLPTSLLQDISHKRPGLQDCKHRPVSIPVLEPQRSIYRGSICIWISNRHVICAGLALASATVAWLMIPKSGDGVRPRPRSV